MGTREEILAMVILLSVINVENACPDGKYRDYLIKCYSCRGNCATCTSWNDCNSCKAGYYGNSCRSLCDSNCVNTACNQADGTCLYGCASGYYQSGSRCVNCHVPYCEKCRDWNHCTKCASGYKLLSSDNCSICQAGTWGYQCQNSCSGNCLNTDCRQSDGICFSCQKYLYGYTCRYRCSDGCKDDTSFVCYRGSGKCIHGCKAGYPGTFCDSVDGQWSEWSDYGQCSVTCGSGIRTKNRSCDNPAPKNDGQACSGSDIQTIICNMTDCPDSTGQPGDDSGNGGAVIGGVAGGAVLLVIVGVALAVLFILRRRRREEKSNDGLQVIYVNNQPATAAVHGVENNSYNAETNQADSIIEVHQDSIREDDVYAQPDKPKKGERKASIKTHTEENLYSSPQKEKTKNNPGKKKREGKGKESPDMIHIPPVPRKLSHYMEDDDLEEINESNISEMDTTEGKVSEQSDTYYNMAGLIRHRIPVENLANTVAEKSADDFLQEFESLTDGLSRDYVAAVNPENKYRNRYKMIYPYDISRVKLTGEWSDYINASYIDGYQQSQTYIACLGPTETITDKFVLFWTMIWQQKVEKIVMLTRLMEGKKMKCEQYWPDTDCESYGNITVYRISEINYAEFSIRDFDVVKGSERRHICQIHYLAWPDRGVPDDVTSLLEFRHKVDRIPTCLNGPTVVHCSAGIGRTGTYIALDMLIREGSEEQYVDVFGCVNGIRGQRVNLVQNVDQYTFLHHALVHELTLPCQMLSPGHLAWFVTEEGRNELRRQFKQLQAVIQGPPDMDTESVRRNKDLKTKNRKETDVPGDRQRVKLKSKKRGSSDYINATFINGYIKGKQIIVAQTPLPETLVDFVELIMQENITCIVSMDPEIIHDITVGIYLPPANQNLEVDIYTITCTQSESFAYYVMRSLEVSKRHGRGTKKRTVYHFQPTLWQTNDPVPSDAADFVRMVSVVEQTAASSGENGGVTLIHCLNAAERSGLFCGVALLIQKLRHEQNISVINTVRQLKSIRHLAIPYEEQYIFCHECVVANQASIDNAYTNLD